MAGAAVSLISGLTGAQAERLQGIHQIGSVPPTGTPATSEMLNASGYVGDAPWRARELAKAIQLCAG